MGQRPVLQNGAMYYATLIDEDFKTTQFVTRAETDHIVVILHSPVFPLRYNTIFQLSLDKLALIVLTII